ncbi:MAG: right-handed parallel beta-helix repeat-containing protein [Pirellulales bacterium]|nr:right-handed parallel beta-helix repeat-containing protein [Pirellulales bacterium]
MLSIASNYIGNNGSTYDNETDGIYCDGTGMVTIASNTIVNNGDNGIELDGNDSMALQVQIYYNAIGTNATGTTVLSNDGCGIHAVGLRGAGGNSFIFGNEIRYNGESGVALANCQDVILEQNSVRSNDASGVNADNSEDLLFLRNTIADNNENGIVVVASGSTGTSQGIDLQGNLVSGNDGHGILLSSTTGGDLSDVTISPAVVDNGNGTYSIYPNVISENGADGVAVASDGSGSSTSGVTISATPLNDVLYGNQIEENIGAGVSVHCTNQASTHDIAIIQNTFTDNSGGSVVAADAAVYDACFFLNTFVDPSSPIQLTDGVNRGLAAPVINTHGIWLENNAWVIPFSLDAPAAHFASTTFAFQVYVYDEEAHEYNFVDDLAGTTDANGHYSSWDDPYYVGIPAAQLSVGDWVTIVATDLQNGNTSEFSNVEEIAPPMPGDANLNGNVDGEDAAVLAAHWLWTSNVGWTEADFNLDGTVDDLDLAILAANWTPDIPEPPGSDPDPLQVTSVSVANSGVSGSEILVPTCVGTDLQLHPLPVANGMNQVILTFTRAVSSSEAELADLLTLTNHQTGAVKTPTGGTKSVDGLTVTWTFGATLQTGEWVLKLSDDVLADGTALDGEWTDAPRYRGDTSSTRAFSFSFLDMTSGDGFHGGDFEFAFALRLPGDADMDGMVNDADAQIVAQNLGTASGAAWTDGDFNADGDVDESDLAILAGHWHDAYWPQLSAGTSYVNAAPKVAQVAVANSGVSGSAITVPTRRGDYDQLLPLPVFDAAGQCIGMDQVILTFDRPISTSGEDLRTALTLTDQYGTGTQHGATSAAVSADGTVVTWTFGATQRLGNWVLRLSDVVAADGVALDGEWDGPANFDDASGTSFFLQVGTSGQYNRTSGDGQPGGDFAFGFSLLMPGDIDLDGEVYDSDCDIFYTYYPMASGATWANGDFDFDGDVDAADEAVADANWELHVWPVGPTVAKVEVANSAVSGSEVEIPTDAGDDDQLLPLPVFDGMNRVIVTFSEPVLASVGDLVLVDRATGTEYTPTGATTDGSTVTWTFGDTWTFGNWAMRLSDAVKAADGRALDGEWDGPKYLGDTSGTSDFFDDTTSGDGAYGGDFHFLFSLLLPGDADLDGKVSFSDFEILLQHYPTASGAAWTDGDFNLDGMVSLMDLDIMGDHWLEQSASDGPKVAGVAVAKSGVSGSTVAIDTEAGDDVQLFPLTVYEDMDQVIVTFDRPVDALVHDLVLRDQRGTGTIFTPTSVSIDGETVTWTFATTWDVGEWVLTLSDSIAAEGVPLDGEWDGPGYVGDPTGTSAFDAGGTSGDGVCGGDFVMAFALQTTPGGTYWPTALHVAGVSVANSAVPGSEIEIPTAAEDFWQLDPLPVFDGVNQVIVTFDQAVTSSTEDLLDYLTLTNQHGFGTEYTPTSVEVDGLTVTWTFDTTWKIGAWVLSLSDAIAASGAGPLDGEWDGPEYRLDTSGTSSFEDGGTSGDGAYGGDFDFAFSLLLPGDANLSGTVTGTDSSIVASHWLMSGMTWEEGDFNGDGLVDDLDLAVLAANYGSQQWPQAFQVTYMALANSAVPGSTIEMTPEAGDDDQLLPVAVFDGVNQVTLAFTRAVASTPAQLLTYLTLTDQRGEGTEYAPTSVTVNGSTVTWTFGTTWKYGEWVLELSDAIAATNGLSLDGEWDGPDFIGDTSGTSQFWNDGASGDGQVGGDFAYAFSLLLQGDANLDGRVDDIDWEIFATYWGTTSGATWYQGDFTFDGQVSPVDFSIMASHIGQTYWPAPASAPVVTGNPTSAIDLVFAQYGYFNEDPDDDVTIGDDLWDDFLADLLVASGVA